MATQVGSSSSSPNTQAERNYWQTKPGQLWPDTSSRSAPKALPKWSEIGSGHPEGASNPPSALLHLSREGARCGKAWYRAKRASSNDNFKLVTVDGTFWSRYIDVAGRVGIPVECPKGTADALKKVQAAAAASAKNPLPSRAGCAAGDPLCGL